MIRLRTYICAIAMIILSAFPAYAAETSVQNSQFCDSLTAGPAVGISQEAVVDSSSVLQRSLHDPGDAGATQNAEETDSVTAACLALNTVVDTIERYDKRVVSL